MKGIRKCNLYFLDGSTVACGAIVVDKKIDFDTTRLRHTRLGLVGEKALSGLIKSGLLKSVKTGKLEFCAHCVLGKQTIFKFDVGIHRTEKALDYIHIDVGRSSKVGSLGGKHWFVSFVDDFSRRVWVYPMWHKMKFWIYFWKKITETQTSRKIKRIRRRDCKTFHYEKDTSTK